MTPNRGWRKGALPFLLSVEDFDIIGPSAMNAWKAPRVEICWNRWQLGQAGDSTLKPRASAPVFWVSGMADKEEP
jgi:hypothetical protein